jgi:signal transduction histidine kinase
MEFTLASTLPHRHGAEGDNLKKIPLNLAIVGGGRACRFFLELLTKEPFPLLDIHVVGVCDINPKAAGFQLAREMGIFTTRDYRDLFAIEHLDSIVELTSSRKLLIELIAARPKGVGVIEHNIGRLLRSLFMTDQRMKSLERQVVLEKMSTDILIQHSNAAIVILNTDFTVVEANEAFLKKVHKTKKEAVGAYCFEISHGLSMPCPNARPELRCPMIETLRTGKSAHVIHEMAGSGFEASFGNIVTYPLIDPDGTIIRVIEIWRDISSEIESRWNGRYQKLKLEFKKLVQEDRMISLGKLVAGCVHEINNPIQGLLTFTSVMQSMLSDGALPADDVAEFRKYLAMMSEELERCGRIVSGLLSFSRERPVQSRTIDVNDTIRSVVSLTQHKMQMQGITLQTNLSQTPLTLTGDTLRLQQSILNLVFNAIEAMPDGGTLAVCSRRDRKKKHIEIDITDTGPGIPEEHLDKIFTPFFTTKPAGQGPGLGLSIVYDTVKANRGDIAVDSRPGEGCRFVLTFPQVDATNDRQKGAP